MIGDQVERKVGGDANDAAILVLRMVRRCLSHPKMHSTIAWRDCDMPNPDAAWFVRRWQLRSGISSPLFFCRDQDQHRSGEVPADKQMRLIQLDGRTWQPIGDVIESAFSDMPKT